MDLIFLDFKHMSHKSHGEKVSWLYVQRKNQHQSSRRHQQNSHDQSPSFQVQGQLWHNSCMYLICCSCCIFRWFSTYFLIGLRPNFMNYFFTILMYLINYLNFKCFWRKATGMYWQLFVNLISFFQNGPIIWKDCHLSELTWYLLVLVISSIFYIFFTFVNYKSSDIEELRLWDKVFH